MTARSADPDGPVPDERTGTVGWFTTVSSRVVHEGFSTVRVDSVRMPDGSVVEREIVERPAAAAVVPVTDDGDVLLLRQYRAALGRYQLEIPAGLIDVEGETPEETARRELVEEIHHEARSLLHLATIDTSAGWSDEQVHLFLGTELRPAAPPESHVAEAEEAHMEIVRFALDDALEIARSGQIGDAKSAIGILLAGAHLDR
jgi:8-oxo-dGDP phosphatase